MGRGPDGYGAMPKRSNGTPGKKPPAPSISQVPARRQASSRSASQTKAREEKGCVPVIGAYPYVLPVTGGRHVAEEAWRDIRREHAKESMH
jgi:hypothetical protein